jgi:Flp pilus assembly protein TadG
MDFHDAFVWRWSPGIDREQRFHLLLSRKRWNYGGSDTADDDLPLQLAVQDRAPVARAWKQLYNDDHRHRSRAAEHKLTPMFQKKCPERGQTIVLVAASMVAFMALVALAIDVTTLYIARNEPQAAADSAALAGARAFAISGYTSGFITQATAQAMASQLAISAGTQARVGGQTLQTSDITVAFPPGPSGNPRNPRINVTVTRTGLPMFFSRIFWSASQPQVSVTASAEAYNPSGSGGSPGPFPVQVSGVKPWLIANCPVSAASTPNNANCATPFFIDNINDGSIVNNGHVGEDIILIEAPRPDPTLPAVPPPPSPPPQPYIYYPIDIPLAQTACPNTSLVPGCSAVGTGDLYEDNIGCFNSFPMACSQATIGPLSAQNILVDNRLQTGVLPLLGSSGAQCLIHASGTSLGPTLGQDSLIQSAGQAPVISPGSNNPDAAVRNATATSRSDSIVTVPLYDGRNLCTTSGSLPCDGNAPIVGFLQLFVTFVDSTNRVHAVILNASGCDPNATSTTPISGGGVSPVPVRLIQKP